MWKWPLPSIVAEAVSDTAPRGGSSLFLSSREQSYSLYLFHLALKIHMHLKVIYSFFVWAVLAVTGGGFGSDFLSKQRPIWQLGLLTLYW